MVMALVGLIAMSETKQCPNCGSDLVVIDDPGLPPNLGNEECEGLDCNYVNREILI